MMRSLTLAALFLFAVAGAQSQQVGQNQGLGQQQNFTLTVNSNLVVEAVTVRDKHGNFIPGLKAEDFVLTENGEPQTIRYCEHQSLAETAKPLPPSIPKNEEITIYNQLVRSQIASESIDNERYKNRRLLALYFDMTALPPADQMRSLTAAETFIRTQMTTADMIAVLRFEGGSVDILQDFTDDRKRLLSILETMVVGEGQGSAGSVDDSSTADTGAAFGQDDSQFNVFNTDRQLSALETAARMLGHVNEKKSLLYFASGLRLNGIDNQAQLHATVDAAIKAGVSIWTIDARGLVAQAPLGDATQSSPGGQAMYTGASALAVTTGFQQSQDTLYAIASDTGGKAFLDNNDLTRGIVQAQQAISDYYILGYYTSNAERDGKFRRIRISLKQNQEAKLEFRQGYYADKEFRKFNDVDRERQLEDALMLDDPITDLTIAMEVDYFQLNRAEYFVPIVVKIPGRELALAKRGGAEYTRIDFMGEIKDLVGGTTVSNVRDNVNIKVSDATAAELAHRPIEYDTGFTLLPGKYSIKFLARDDETGRIGTYQTNFVIPNLNKEVNRVPISAVVLGSQRVDLKAAIYDAAKAKDRARDEAANPLVQDGRKLIPSVTRVFSTGHQIFVYFQAYKQEERVSSTPATPPAPISPLFAFVTLYQDGKKLLETPPKAIVPNAASRLGTMPLSVDLGVDALPRGRYDCQITVLDPATKKAAFWRAPIMLVQ
ncbi:MAG TPA: VWA domain-containing protein [Terracidiphilus sp.]|jgi:VWFA-related protein|nr:VWA domain-containing protein [Terracidiphilus sp.]